MKRIALQGQRRVRGSVCQLCAFSTSPISRRLAPRNTTTITTIKQGVYSTSRVFSRHNGIAYRFFSTAGPHKTETHSDFGARRVLSKAHSMISSTRIPTEEAVLDILERSQDVVDASKALEPTRKLISAEIKKRDPVSSLLELDIDEDAAPEPEQHQPENEDASAATSAISDMLNELLQDPKVFISPDILKLYTSIQCQLGKVDHIPTIFSLYANKPSPRASKGTITYHTSNPKSAKNAIPPTIAHDALEVAMEQKNLSLALAIIDTAFCTPAFYRSKILRKASIPFAGLMATPPAAWALSSYIASLQTAMDPSSMRNIAFSAMLAYITFTSTFGLVAAVTSNDHMQRVVWIPGTALRSRWLREEEREALDRVAQMWGFKDPLMRGDETGEEWEALREILGMRGMILDKTSHMEGME